MTRKILTFLLSAFALAGAAVSATTYTFYDSIESTGKQRVLTGVPSSPTLEAELDLVPISSTGDRYLGHQGNDSADWRYFDTGATLYFDIGDGRVSANGLTKGSTRYCVHMTSESTKFTATVTEVDTGYQCRSLSGTFSQNPSGAEIDLFNGQQMRVYGLKMWDYLNEGDAERTLLRDFIPAVENTDGTQRYGLYDTVNKKFYPDTNGTEAFKLGAVACGISVFGSPSQFGTPDPDYGKWDWDDGENVTFTCPTAYTNDAQTVAARLLGYSHALTNGETYVGTAASTSIVYTALTQRSTLTWRWAVQYKVSITNMTGEAALSLDGGATWFAETNAWLDADTAQTLTVREDLRRFLKVSGTGAEKASDGSYPFTVTAPMTIVATLVLGDPGVFQKIYNTSDEHEADPEDGGVIISDGAILLATPSGSPSISATASDGTKYTLGANSTVGYKFAMNMTAGKTYTFVKNFDDNGHIRIATPDGSQTNAVLDSTSYSEIKYGSYTPASTGYHTLFVYCGNGGGGIGPTTAPFNVSPYAAILWNDTGLTSCTTANRSQWHRLLNDETEGKYLYANSGKGLVVSGSPAPFGTPDPGYGFYEPHAGETLELSCPTVYTNDAQGVAARLLGFSYKRFYGEEDVSTASSTSIVYSSANEGSTLTWLWKRSYRVTVTNMTGEAVLLPPGASTPVVAFTTWVEEGEDLSFTTVAATGRKIAFFDFPTNCAFNADFTAGTVQSVFESATVHLASFTPDYVWTGASSTAYDLEANWVTATGEPTGSPNGNSTVFIPEGAANYPELPTALAVRTLYIGSLTNGTGVASLTMKHKDESTVSGDLYVFPGGKLTHTAVSSSLFLLDSENRKLIVRVNGNAVIATGGSLDVVGRGFATSMGPGGRWFGDQKRAAHGGTTCAGYCYGSLTCPTNCGTGGNYGPGGGAIKLTVDGTCTLNGAINANSATVEGRCSGSGGSAWLTCGTLCGTGTVSATAGNTTWAGSGSGGRVAVYVRRDSTGFSGTFEANPGYNTGHGHTFGGPGTVYVERETDAPGRGTVYISASNVLRELGSKYASVIGFTELPSFTASNVVITNLARVSGLADSTIDLTGSWYAEDVRFNDYRGTLRLSGAADAVVSGSNSFARLLCEVPGKKIRFGTGAKEETIVSQSFVMRGDAENLLSLAGVNGGTWLLTLDAGAGADVRYAAVAGSDASCGTYVTAYDSTEGDPECVNWSFCATPQPGAAISWVGLQSTSWFDARNWDPERVPVETDVVTVGPAERSPVLALNDITLNSLTVESGGTLTLDGADVTVTNALTVRGTLAFTALERATVQGTADLAGGTFVPAYGTFVLGGDLAQTADFTGVTLSKLYVRKSAGSVTFAHGFAATTFDFSGCGAGVTMTFAANETVTCGEFACANGTLVSATPGTPWMLNVTGSQAVQGTTVTDSHATGIAIYADATSHAVSGCDRWYFGSIVRTWTGGGAEGDWSDAANWSPEGVPDTSSRVTIANAAVTVAGAAVAQNVILDSGASLTVARDASLACEDSFDVKSGATATLNGPLTVTNSVIVRGGGLITHTEQESWATKITDERYRIFITAGGEITVEADGAIDATSKGYAHGKGPGGSYSGYDGGGKAGHGGGYNDGCCYGSMLCPTNCGTGYQTRGGGAVRLVAGGTLRVDGTVAADAGANETGTGSGAGGSVWVAAARLAGYGTLRADGGYANYYYTGCGGRIAVYLSEATDFTGWTGEIHARGGFCVGYPTRTAGCSGTVYLQTAGQDVTTATVILENLGATTLSGGCGPMVEMKAACQSDVVGNLIVTNATRISVPAGETLKVYGDWRYGQAFSSISGEVRFCGENDAHLCGNAVFANLSCEEPGKKLYFGTSSADVFTFATGSRITFSGSEEEHLSLLPETPTGTWTFTLTTDCKSTVTYANVSNSNASAGLAVLAECSQDLGGNLNWGFSSQKIQPGDPIYWTGVSSTLWSDVQNWVDKTGANRTPVESDRVIIPKEGVGITHWPVLTTGTTVQNAIEILANGVLTVRDCTLYPTNELSVSGTLIANGAARIICSNAVTFTTATSFEAGESTFRLEGPLVQAVNPGGNTFHRFEVEKAGGSVTFADGLTAQAFDVLTVGSVRLAFAPGRTVEAEEMIVRGQTDGTEETTAPLVLASAEAEETWRVRATGLQFFSGVDVSDSEALGETVYADALSHDGGRNANWSFGADRVAWTGAKSTAFADAENWYPQRVPGAGSTVLLTARRGETKTVSVSSATVLSNLCAGAGLGTITVSAGASAPLTVCDTLAVYSNATVALNSKDVPNVVSNFVYVGPGGILTHDALSSSATTVEQQDKRLYLDVLGDMTVETFGAVDVANKGFPSYKGPSVQKWGNYYYGDHGGARGTVHSYGSVFEPVTCGSGGNGAAGGGVILLSVAGTLTVNGVLKSDAGACSDASPAGGSLNVRCGTLAGAGPLYARGSDCNTLGGGSGGRVALRVRTSMADFTGAIDAGGGYTTRTADNYGGAGTVYVLPPGTAERYGTITVSNARLRNRSNFSTSTTRQYTELPVTEPEARDPYKRATLVIDDLADVRLTDDMRVGDLDIRNATVKLRLQGHTLTVSRSKHKNGRFWADTYENLVVEDGGKIVWLDSGTVLRLR